MTTRPLLIGGRRLTVTVRPVAGGHDYAVRDERGREVVAGWIADGRRGAVEAAERYAREQLARDEGAE